MRRCPCAGDSKLAPSEENTIRVFRENTPSVVNINTFTNAQSFTMDVDRIPQGQGSGIVWDDSGHIVTNFHVPLCASNPICT